MDSFAKDYRIISRYFDGYLLVLDKDLKISFCSEAMKSFLGSSSIGHDFKNYVSNEDLHLLDILDPTKDLPLSCIVFDIKLKNKTINQTKRFLFDIKLNHENNCFYLFGKDVSSIARRQEYFEELAEKLKASNRDLDEFAYVVSHDLKAPLRGIVTVAQWINEDYGDKLEKDLADNLRLIVERARHANHLIESLLNFSRALNRQDELSEVDPGQIVNEIKASLNIPKNLDFQVQENLPKFKYHYTQLYHIFQNLISNSIKYANKENPKVSISANENLDSVEFTVEDNGIGIDPKDQERIFKIFQVVDPSNKESTGIGLSIVKKIIERSDGKIKLESELGKGTKFCFTLRKNSANLMSENP